MICIKTLKIFLRVFKYLGCGQSPRHVINDVLLTDKKISDEKKQEFLVKNRKELERIEWLVTSLLKMSRLDSGSETLKIKEVEA